MLTKSEANKERSQQGAKLRTRENGGTARSAFAFVVVDLRHFRSSLLSILVAFDLRCLRPSLLSLFPLSENRAQLIDLATIRRPIAGALRRERAIVVLLRLTQNVGGNCGHARRRRRAGG